MRLLIISRNLYLSLYAINILHWYAGSFDNERMSRVTSSDTPLQKRRPVTFTVRPDLIEEARSLNLNASRAAEAGLEAAVKAAKEKAWLRDNQAAIQAYNERIKREGMLIKPIWLQQD
jgi:antitoxin CcdA